MAATDVKQSAPSGTTSASASRSAALVFFAHWAQSPTKKAMLAVAEVGREVRRIRAEALPNIKGGLRELYRTLVLPGANPLKAAHATLDKAVLAAYGFHPAKDLLAQLLALNQSVAANIESGQPVTAPGLPMDGKDRLGYLSADCIQPTSP